MNKKITPLNIVNANKKNAIPAQIDPRCANAHIRIDTSDRKRLAL